MTNLRIGDAAKATSTSADTLRYYEKIGLLQMISRDSAGRRFFNSDALARIHFIRRAQGMGFSLQEIGLLLDFRRHPDEARAEVRDLAKRKLDSINAQIIELQELQQEFAQLITACSHAEDGCPIIENIDQPKT